MSANFDKPPPGTPTPQEMLEQYRQMSNPLMRMQAESFRKMTLNDRDELLYYGVLYCYEQLAGILTYIQRLSGRPSDKPN